MDGAAEVGQKLSGRAITSLCFCLRYHDVTHSPYLFSQHSQTPFVIVFPTGQQISYPCGSCTQRAFGQHTFEMFKSALSRFPPVHENVVPTGQHIESPKYLPGVPQLPESQQYAYPPKFEFVRAIWSSAQQLPFTYACPYGQQVEPVQRFPFVYP